MSKRLEETRSSQTAEYVGRSRADRLLDGILNKQRRELFKRKMSETPSVKRTKTQYSNLDEKGTSDSATKQQTAKPLSSKSVNEALDEIIHKHLKHRSKYAKSVKLVNSMLTANYADQSNILIFLRTFYEIILSETSFTCEQGRKEVSQLFTEGLKHFWDLQTSDEESENTNPDSLFEKYKPLIDVLLIRINHIKLFTDDTYQFTGAVNHFKFLLNELIEHHRQRSIDEAMYNSPNSHTKAVNTISERLDSDNKKVTNSQNSINLAQPENKTLSPVWDVPNNDELWELKLKFLIDALPTIYNYRHHPWAEVAVENFFQLVYLNRMIFNEHEQERITSWQSSIKTSKKPSLNVKTYSIGEAVNPFKDTREQKISTVHGSAVWSAKQSGL